MGGYKFRGTNTCEYYDIQADEWKSFANLNKKKGYCSASILNDQFIYLFGGINSMGNTVDTIEKYDIKERQYWVIIDLKLCIHGLNSITISPTEILLFDGYRTSHKTEQTNTYIFNG